MAKLSLISATFVLIFFAEHVNGVSIQFYSDSNFTDLVFASNSTANCNIFPVDFQNTYINYIKTDTCLIVFFQPNCQSYSRKFDPDNRLGWDYALRSFHTCNENVGGPQLNVDITKWYDLYDRPTEIPDVLDRVPSLDRIFMAERQKTERQKPERHFTEYNIRPNYR